MAPELETPTLNWPAAPYKGLSYYQPGDAPLFAGREEDVWQCARLLEQPSTRLLVLHGMTGCGKSSFLRAGLMPHLEDPTAGFRFYVTDAGWFIRCTSRPMESLAGHLAKFVQGGLRIETPRGAREINLRKALPEEATVENAPEILASNPAILESVVQRLSNIVPQTLILVVDQAEEVLTLDQSAEGEQARQNFFQFLSLFTRSTYDVKIVIALRTEYYGRFYSRTRRAQAEVTGIREYFLDELTTDQSRQAIVRPTLPDTPPGMTIPARKYYRFSYAEGLPEQIIKDLNDTVVAGGILPVLQLVCSTLYERTKPAGEIPADWVITEADYRALGGPEGQVEEHLENVLLERARKNNITPLATAFREVDRWKEVLFRLVRMQADGSATTDIVKEEELLELISKKDCKMPGTDTLDYLGKDEVRILREVYVLDRETRDPVKCFSLGHDTLGLVLRRWKAVRDQTVARLTASGKNMFKLAIVILALAVPAGILKAFGFKWMTWLDWSTVILGTVYGIGFVIGASYMPRMALETSSPSPGTAGLFRFAIRYTSLIQASALSNPANKRLFQAYPDLRDLLLARVGRQKTAGTANK